GIGGLLARTDNGQLNTGNSQAHSYFHCDGNGNVTMLINTQQFAMAKYLYDPFGNTLSVSGPLADANRYRFSSKPIQTVSGMYDYLYRWYVTDLQIWLNRDPIDDPGFALLGTLESADGDAPNLYWYNRNDPLNHFDHFGLNATGESSKHPFCETHCLECWNVINI